MSPRPYNLGKRHEQIDQGRRQILDAARALLAEAASYTDFTLDAVAKRADVARGTVYYQFSSKTGLLEALCDHLGELGGLHELPQAFTNPEPAAALATFIACFSRFWQADRAVMRRLRALAALDPDVHSVIASRDQRRYHGLELLLSRFAGAGTAPVAVERDRTVRALQAVTSFETFDTLALPNQSLEEVVPEIVRLAAAVVNQMTPRRRA